MTEEKKPNHLIEYFFKDEQESFKDIILKCLSGNNTQDHSICFTISERIKDSEEELEARYETGRIDGREDNCDE